MSLSSICLQCLGTVWGINSRVARVGTFEVCVPIHVALRMFIMQVLPSQLHFLANKNAELAIPLLFWPVNCIKIGGHVALLSDPTFIPYTVVWVDRNSLPVFLA